VLIGRRNPRFVKECRRIGLRADLAERRLHLRRQDQKLPSGLHDDFPDVATGGGDDFHRLPLG
jgi:hypothetical protein